ncbi:MAG: vitamin K epoxide reductase family protein [Terriglobales bacterium]
MMSMVAVLAVCGAVISAVSLQHHFAKSKTAYCDLGEAFNCDIVNRSEYSAILGVPVALIGMLGYLALLALATVYRKRRETPVLLFGGAAAGLAFALYLTYVEARILGVWCILCLSSLALIAMTTLFSGVIWLRR